MMYIYRDFTKEWGCWTVGFYDPDNVWHPESDYPDSEEAARRVAWLNGRDQEDRV